MTLFSLQSRETFSFVIGEDIILKTRSFFRRCVDEKKPANPSQSNQRANKESIARLRHLYHAPNRDDVSNEECEPTGRSERGIVAISFLNDERRALSVDEIQQRVREREHVTTR